mmetsp:Transcript_31564/g.46836  ORF Transcript_31564/g.46836 Transcript_31564/m.46836 type:complete len:169 (-) Transcript_31564:117-623(-)
MISQYSRQLARRSIVAVHNTARAQQHVPYSQAQKITRFQSAQAVAAAPRRATRRKKLDPIIVTEGAAVRVKELLSGPNAEGAVGIRLGTKRRGCNGLSYTLNYVFPDDIPPKDEKFESHGIQVYIEPMALMNVIGTTMDWEETELTSEFTFKNPNSKGECGCGESFNV